MATATRPIDTQAQSKQMISHCQAKFDYLILYIDAGALLRLQKMSWSSALLQYGLHTSYRMLIHAVCAIQHVLGIFGYSTAPQSRTGAIATPFNADFVLALDF